MKPNKGKHKNDNVLEIMIIKIEFIDNKNSIQQICKKYHLSLKEALEALSKSYEYQEMIEGNISYEK